MPANIGLGKQACVNRCALAGTKKEGPSRCHLHTVSLLVLVVNLSLYTVVSFSARDLPSLPAILGHCATKLSSVFIALLAIALLFLSPFFCFATRGSSLFPEMERFHVQKGKVALAQAFTHKKHTHTHKKHTHPHFHSLTSTHSLPLPPFHSLHHSHTTTTTPCPLSSLSVSLILLSPK